MSFSTWKKSREGTSATELGGDFKREHMTITIGGAR